MSLQLNVIREPRVRPAEIIKDYPLPSLLETRYGSTGKRAVKELSHLTLEEKAEHAREMSKQRNMRRQEKINLLRELEYLPTNCSKIEYLLLMFNPVLKDIDRELLRNNINVFLETLSLV